MIARLAINPRRLPMILGLPFSCLDLKNSVCNSQVMKRLSANNSEALCENLPHQLFVFPWLITNLHHPVNLELGDLNPQISVAIFEMN